MPDNLTKAHEKQPKLRLDPKERYTLLKVWYKVAEDSADRLAILYVYEWDKSVVPVPGTLLDHDWDYEPIIYCHNKRTGTTMWIYDSGHYVAGKTAGSPAGNDSFDVVEGTHRYKPANTPATTTYPTSKMQELDETTLKKWEKQLAKLVMLPGYGQLSLWEAFLNPCGVADTGYFTVPPSGSATERKSKYAITAT